MIRNGDIEMIDPENQPLFNGINFDNPKEVLQYIDDRGFNYLMIAAETGDNNLIEPLLKIGIDVNTKFGGHTAASLAHANRHFDTLLLLLKANSKFPPNFNAFETQHDGLIEFTALMSRFHDSVRTEEEGDILRILEKNESLQHFYNTNNTSAPLDAVKNGMFDMYELLITHNIFVAPSENFSDAIEGLSEDQKLQLRQIHEKHAIGFEENHLRVICGSLFVGHDVAAAERRERLMIAKRAFFFLNTIPMIRQILLLIASARCFKIIFDFNRDHIQFIDPTNDTATRGAFYLSRHIYIAAKRLLDSVERFGAYGTIAHELCHFAMDLVYDNCCDPFLSHDLQRKFQFFFIASDSQSLAKVEKIVSSVFTSYSGALQNAELIVRVPQMVATYANDPERLRTLRAVFHRLFEYYETLVMPDIERAIPNINDELNDRCERFLETTKKRASRWRAFSIVALGSAVLLAVAIFFCLNRPTYSWGDMSDIDKNTALNGTVEFAGVPVPFRKLFGEDNSNVTEGLSSQQIETLLGGKTLDLSDSKNSHLVAKIQLAWSNSSEKLRAKIRRGHVNFQGQKFAIDQLIDDDAEIYNQLSSNQLVQLIRNESFLVVGREMKIDSGFYVERLFRRKFECCVAERYEDLRAEANEKRVILLADGAGMGKTTTFRNFMVKLKQASPFKWVSFVELKKHVDVYKRGYTDVMTVLMRILNYTEESYEFRIFEKLFWENRTIFLWDGFDEIAPTYSDCVLDLFAEISESTKNQQWISSRPRHVNDIEKRLNVMRFTMKPYSKEERELFLRNLFAFRHQSYDTYKPVIDDVIKSIESNSDEIVASPLLLHMIANVTVDLPRDSQSHNLYSIYEEFINQKTSIFLFDKGDIAKYEIQKSLSRDSRIDHVYEHFAIKQLFPDGVYRDYSSFGFSWPLSGLDVMQNNYSEYFDAVSRRGLLRVESEDVFSFDHQTFAEFYVARYLIERVCNNKAPFIDLEIERRLNFFFASLQIPKVCDFLLYYPDHCFFLGRFMSVQLKKYKQVLKTLLSDAPYAEDQILTIGTLPKLLRFQKPLVRQLWEVDANQTFANFYAIAYPRDFVDNHDFLARFAHGILKNDTDEAKFMRGAFQRGNFLVSSLRLNDTYGYYGEAPLEEYFARYFEILSVDTSDFEVEKLRACKDFHQVFLYLRSFLSPEELMEIFMRKHWSVFELDVPHLSDLNGFWRDLEATFSPQQIQQILLNPIEDDFFILSYAFDTVRSTLSNGYFLETVGKYKKFVNSTNQLRWTLLSRTNNVQYLTLVFDYKTLNAEVLASLFDMVESKLTRKQLRSILLARIKETNGVESDNLLFSALGYTTAASFDLILNIYNKTFTQDEMRKLALYYFNDTQYVDNFLYIYSHFHPHARIDAFEVFIDYVTELFANNYQQLETVVTKFVLHIKSHDKEDKKYAQHFVKVFEDWLGKIRDRNAV